MNNFEYCNPTRIVFGKGSIARLSQLVPADHKVMLVYGGGSIKRNGVYDQVKAALAGRSLIEFPGIQPNPAYEHLMEGVKLLKGQQVDLVLAVGGGSVIDGAKFIAAAAHFTGADPWDILAKGAAVNSAIPVGCVLTLPATGSESNSNSVVSRQSTKEKLAFSSDRVWPKFSILDPAVTMTLPARQTRNGIVDAFIHVMEQYATYPVNAPLQDRQAEGILLTLIEEGPLAIRHPDNYDVRPNLMWCATHALNQSIAVGVPQDWATHMIGHELTAFYGLDHAESLAIVMPRLLRFEHKTKATKLVQFAKRVWDVKESVADRAIEAGIRHMEMFFQSLGMRTRLADHGISPTEAASKIGERFAARGTKLGEHGDITGKEAADILLKC